MPDDVAGEVSRPPVLTVDVDSAVGAVRRQRASGVEAVEGLIDEFLRGTPDLAVESELRLYEAAVRESFSPRLADRALTLLLSSPGIGWSDEEAGSRALLFATAADRLAHLQAWLRELRARLTDPREQFACLLTRARISLIQRDPDGMRCHAGEAVRLDGSPDPERAGRLARESYWFVRRRTPPRISQWRLRGIHHLLPRDVAEWLEDSDLPSPREEDDSGPSSTVRRILDQASDMLERAARITEDPYGRQPRLREAVGAWATSVGSALAASDEASEGVAVPFTGTAWRLLELDLPDEVVEAHALAIAAACAGLDEPGVRTTAERVAAAMPASAGQACLLVPRVVAAWRKRRTRGGSARSTASDLAARLQAVSSEPPPPGLDVAAPAVAYRLGGVPDEVRQSIERCLVDRALLLPDEAPFRGRRWFECPEAHASYVAGRNEPDGVAAYKHFERAWQIEPNNPVTIQGLIMGLRRRLREKPGRDHVLARFASLLDQVDQREVEAAMAYTSLAEHAERAGHQMERRGWLQRAVSALRRRTSRQPWVRARHAEIALQMELGDLAAAGRAAWDEARLRLPGTAASRCYALLAATLWERASRDQPVDQNAVDEAHRLAQSPALTMVESVRYAVRMGHLVLLTDLELDDEALEELWIGCRGNQDELCRFLEKQGSRSVDPRPRYLDFLLRKLEPAVAPSAPGGAGGASCRVERLLLAAAEVLGRDPLQLASSALAEPHLSEFNAVLRECAHQDQGAVAAFTGDVSEALNALFVLREAARSTAPELLVSRLGHASRCVGRVERSARRFRDPSLVGAARLVWRHLAFALEPPMRWVYESEKAKRLVPSQVGTRLHQWWRSLTAGTGQHDLFHLHLLYRCPEGMEPMRWWESSEGHGQRPKDAVRDLARSLEAHAHQLDDIAAYHERKRERHPGTRGFGLPDEFGECLGVLHAALAPGAGPEEVMAVEGALERLGVALRRIDVTRLFDVPDVLYDPALTPGRYLLPRAVDLLSHWRTNAREASLQVVLDLRGDAMEQDVLCLMSVDAGTRQVPATVKLRGLAPFADLVEALGGQFHLWVARKGEPSGCRRAHRGGWECEADEYVRRIERRLVELGQSRPTQLPKVEKWLKTLDTALRSNGNAAVAFALIPPVDE